MRLVIGNKNYSSWSLRPWLLMRQFGLPFEERLLPLDTPEFRERIPALSPSGRVPVLHDGGRVIWDSLAICEYVNEVHLGGRGWPADPGRRALARSAAAEMHSGFAALRAQLPMNCRRQPSGRCWDAAAEADIRRVQALWADLRREAGEGPFLLGDFGIVDAMFAPVVIRFRSYGVPLSATAAAWCETMAALPAMQAWIEAGVREPWRVGADER
ncbi:glutathione S-transferase family protein [Silanimonas lenta]|uniref:glutathione S-transferase family protein n=1 Tax=Silanimonas lenta TaxID=265429 RepID=UPI00041DA783|nr:glutathione S-transferase family protein [Silanimonas lenta]